MFYLSRSLLLLFLFIASACSSSDDALKRSPKNHQKGEYLYRRHDDFLFQIPPQELQAREPYPWEQGQVGDQVKITKEFFRCKGSSLNPPHIVQEKTEMVRYGDCGGSEKHSLPLRDGKEFVYPILMDLLNYIQAKSQKRVVITSGHRCPEHNSYVDASAGNRYSKHMVGAEVSFYVQGMESRPEVIVDWIQEYYKKTAKYGMKPDYIEFKRYDKNDNIVQTLPWYNKEVFVKIFKKTEGRNFDNRHPYPYISIQVRYDEDLKEKVIYTWDKAFRNYLRH